ncbi:MAG TPA: DegV family protein [Chloroflexi bacterium]|nr:DegV family protein [Chloroflexota bacterium]
MGARIRIIVDSTADLPPALLERWDIVVLPIYLLLEGRSYRDDAALDRARFYEQLAQHRLKTAAPPPHEFLAAYEALVAAGAEEIIGLFISASLSSIYGNAQLAAQQLEGARVHIVDTGQISMGIGWLAIAAAQAAAEGATASEIVALLEELRQRVLVVGVLESITHLHRSGRVNWATAWVGEILQIKPLIYFYTGEAGLIGKVRTHRRAVQALADWIVALGPLEQVAFLHSHTNPRVSARFQAELTPVLPELTLQPIEVSPVLGVHIGPGGLGVALVQASNGGPLPNMINHFDRESSC